MSEKTVEIEQGKLRGKTGNDLFGREFYSFQGIPYAKPPVGNLRFKAPQPPEPWTGVRDATKEGSPCYSLHMIHLNLLGSEDCLFLNVYTPQLPTPTSQPKPVMVWIHGGGFMAGSGDAEMYGPEFLVSEDVVLVTINYRLGALGFLCLEDPKLEVPGNAGLKDQVMALKWVQKNIAKFGGNPNNVAIFGESAGSASVHFLVLSPMAKGLFHRAIMQSGAVFNPWAWADRQSAKNMCEYFKIQPKDDAEILRVLQEAPIKNLYKAQLMLKDHMRADIVRPFGAVIEKVSPYEEAFLCEAPLDIILQGRYNTVPMMIGYTSREGMLMDLILLDDEMKKKQFSNFEDSVPFWLYLERGSPRSLEVAQKIKKFYFGDQEPYAEDKDPVYKLETDLLFLRGIYTSTKHHAVTNPHPVFMYRFSLEGPLNLFKRLAGIEGKGAAHADELGYLFKNFTQNNIDPKSIDCECISTMIRLWANFAKHGNPNSPGPDDVISIDWKPVTGDKLNVLDIDFNLTMVENPEKERMEFWDDIFKFKPASAKL